MTTWRGQFLIKSFIMYPTNKIFFKAQNCGHFGHICYRNVICVTSKYIWEGSRLLVHNSLRQVQVDTAPLRAQ